MTLNLSLWHGCDENAKFADRAWSGITVISNWRSPLSCSGPNYVDDKIGQHLWNLTAQSSVYYLGNKPYRMLDAQKTSLKLTQWMPSKTSSPFPKHSSLIAQTWPDKMQSRWVYCHGPWYIKRNSILENERSIWAHQIPEMLHIIDLTFQEWQSWKIKR